MRTTSQRAAIQQDDPHLQRAALRWLHLRRSALVNNLLPTVQKQIAEEPDNPAWRDMAEEYWNEFLDLSMTLLAFQDQTSYDRARRVLPGNLGGRSLPINTRTGACKMNSETPVYNGLLAQFRENPPTSQELIAAINHVKQQRDMLKAQLQPQLAEWWGDPNIYAGIVESFLRIQAADAVLPELEKLMPKARLVDLRAKYDQAVEAWKAADTEYKQADQRYDNAYEALQHSNFGTAEDNANKHEYAIAKSERERLRHILEYTRSELHELYQKLSSQGVDLGPHPLQQPQSNL